MNMHIITTCLLISMILYYIYETNVVWEYLNKISDIIKTNSIQKILNGILLVKAYGKSNEINYLQFLNKTYNNFYTRLISCPICLSFWICLFFSLINGINLFPTYAFISLTLYFLIKILTKLSSKI